MTWINSVAPNGTASGPLPNTQAQALVTATAAASTSPTAKLLTQTAVVQAALVPSQGQEQRNNKQPIRLASTPQPSSALAAQVIAQSPDISEDELAVFAERNAPQTNTNQTPAQPATADDSFFAQLGLPQNIAQNANVATPVAANNNAPAAAPIAITQLITTAASQAGTIAVARAQVNGLPSIAPAPTGNRRPGIQARGASAYQAAVGRNEKRPVVAFEAIS